MVHKNIDFESIRKTALDKYLEHNKDVFQDKELSVKITELCSTLISTMLYEYHKEVNKHQE